MANDKQAVKPMPFPGESPTVALAMAAGQKYGLHEEDEKPAKTARPKRGGATRKVAAKKPGAKKVATRKSGAKKAPTKNASGGKSRARKTAKHKAGARGRQSRAAI